MHFHKYPHPSNFEFPGKIGADRPFVTRQGTYVLRMRASRDDVYHLQISGKGWKENESLLKLNFASSSREASGKKTVLRFSPQGDLQLSDRSGRLLLSSLPHRFFGQQGQSSIFEFVRKANDQFYGLGEKWSGLEHSNKTVKFWNTDIWGDFNPESYINGKPAPDPTYVSIPYLIIKRDHTYLGLLLDNPFATYISTRFSTSISGQMETSNRNGALYLSAEKGQPNLYLIYGPSLPELTRKLQKLVGTTPLPPAWALGNHQCRWGYQSEADLLDLDRQFRKHKIPVDGLWLDIDYMKGYRIFTFAPDHFPHPEKALTRLKKLERRVIPIIDPGVKLEKGYPVYERGRRARAYCQNRQGGEYVGLVWPGQTVFPDFSLKQARSWWADEVQRFASLGIPGAWLDMNDPSTGPSDNGDMLFDKGRKEHDTFHNQYALGMAAATREGFLKAHPDQRPFLLSRSGSIGIQRYAAIWTGDNYSNYHHLKNSIAITLNLALSGVPFNGADVGGFGGDTSPELIRDWYKAAFLFPFLRNHSMLDTRQQEPWAFDRASLDVLRHYIQLRYRLRPYLYQLFIEHEKTGEAILRPLFYDFDDTTRHPLGLIDDQFLVGPAILQAPFVQADQKQRRVVLPGKCRWYDVAQGKWLAGDQTITCRATLADTPLFIRDNSILPLARTAAEDHAFDAKKIDFHIFQSSPGTISIRYIFDDGQSLAYQKGVRSEVEITVKRTGKTLAIAVEKRQDGYGSGKFIFTTEAAIKTVSVNGRAARRISSLDLQNRRGLLSWIV